MGRANAAFFLPYNRTMAPIEINKLQGFPQAAFEVTVKGNPVTKHIVIVTKEYYEQLTSGSVPPEKLVEESFAFLLARESNTSILPEFDLKVIKKYFSGYERDMQSKFQSK
jgi:hypothetical protein